MLSDADLLDYIERTPELRKALIDARLYSYELATGENYFHPDAKAIARAFHAHKQRVRADEREACARVCEEQNAKEHDFPISALACAAAIRARKEKE